MKIIIVGCGRVGSGLALSLTRIGHTVTVIDLDATAFELLDPSFKGRTLVGFGFDRDVLLEADIEHSDALAAVTFSDEVNAVIARVASQVFHVPKVVARLKDVRKDQIYNRLGLQTIDPTAWGINRIVDLLCFSPLGTVLSIGSGDVDIVEIEVPILLVGRRVKELTIPGEIQVIGISRNNKTFLPTLGTEFLERDFIHLAVAGTSMDQLKYVLGLK
ncbi:potassium channel family protein [Acetobacterium bakii]|uniref:Trk system potassium uptake protein TrkA n=1 Tax=Acetobacterium bakii TaxID=52689 RepID=A0A0L6U2M4_9FIRM|nr:TrkA family potassium uptake protein [Acetobacterium bakii]KNZ42602.1 potassium transporter TrkA [Acetobacterium bakii]